MAQMRLAGKFYPSPGWVYAAGHFHSPLNRLLLGMIGISELNGFRSWPSLQGGCKQSWADNGHSEYEFPGIKSGQSFEEALSLVEFKGSDFINDQKISGDRRLKYCVTPGKRL